MSGGSKSQTTVQSNEPYKPAQPLLNSSIKGAQDLMKGGIGQQVYTGSTVIPFAQQTSQGMGAIQNQANAALAPGGYASQMGNIMQAGGFNQPQQTALQGIQNTATGSFDINSNPAFQDVLRQSQDAARDAVNMNASSAGRYGSGVHQGVMGQTIGDLTSRMVGSEYNNWQNRRDAAQQNLFNAGQQGFQNMGTAFQNQQAPGQSLMDIGSMYEDLAGRLKNDELRIFNESQSKPWEQLARANAIAGGAGQFGTSTNTAQMPGQNPFATGLGYASSLAGILGAF